jgi:t-SNARE complex subunit (syntaxin)
VQGAIENAKKARKYQCCILICVMMVVGILVLVLFVFKKNL